MVSLVYRASPETSHQLHTFPDVLSTVDWVVGTGGTDVCNTRARDAVTGWCHGDI